MDDKSREIERLRLASKAGGLAHDAGRPCQPPPGDPSYRRCWSSGWHFAARQGRGQTPATRPALRLISSGDAI